MTTDRPIHDEPADDRLWTARDVARFLSFHPNTVYLWAAQRKLPCVRLGGRLRFMPRDINRWLLARKEG